VIPFFQSKDFSYLRALTAVLILVAAVVPVVVVAVAVLLSLKLARRWSWIMSAPNLSYPSPSSDPSSPAPGSTPGSTPEQTPGSKAAPSARDSGGALPVAEQVDRIAHRIKTWRTAAGMSLQVLANRSGVSPSTIHKIENGQTVPTIAVLLKLAEGLGRRPTELLEDADGESGAVHTAAGTGAQLVTGRGVGIEWLIGDAMAPELEVWRVTHPEGFTFGVDRIKHLSGDVVLLVESGQLEVRVANDEFLLGAGDTLHFKGTQPHAWSNVNEGPTVALLVGNVQAGARSGLVARMRRLRCGATPNGSAAPNGSDEPAVAS